MNNKKLTCHVECEQFIILGGEGERGEGGEREEKNSQSWSKTKQAAATAEALDWSFKFAERM